MNPMRKHVLTCIVPIRWGDMDALGHVNNTAYFRYMEQARAEWLESLGYPIDVRQREAAVIVNASCTFLLPMNYPGHVEVAMSVGAPGRSSVDTYYELRLRGDDTLYAEGAAKLVWFDTAANKSAALPEPIRAALLAADAPPA